MLTHPDQSFREAVQRHDEAVRAPRPDTVRRAARWLRRLPGRPRLAPSPRLLPRP